MWCSINHQATLPHHIPSKIMKPSLSPPSFTIIFILVILLGEFSDISSPCLPIQTHISKMFVHLDILIAKLSSLSQCHLRLSVYLFFPSLCTFCIAVAFSLLLPVKTTCHYRLFLVLEPLHVWVVFHLSRYVVFPVVILFLLYSLDITTICHSFFALSLCLFADLVVKPKTSRTARRVTYDVNHSPLVGFSPVVCWRREREQW